MNMGQNLNSGVYIIRHIQTKKVYVGSSFDVKRRHQQHIADLRGNHHKNAKLQRAWNKYGESAFEILVIEYVENRGDLITREQYWIDNLEAAGRGNYNIAPKAGSVIGYRHTEETKALLSKKGRGRKLSPAVKALLIECNRNREHSQESRAKRSLLHKGKLVSQETREKQSNAMKGKPKSPEHRAKIAASKTGSKATEQARANMSAAQKKMSVRKPHSAETRAKIAAAQIGRKLTPEAIANRTASRARNKAERRAAGLPKMQLDLQFE